MEDWYVAVFGGLVVLALFFVRELIDLLKYFQETRESESMMLIIQHLAHEDHPSSCEAISEKTNLRFGVLKRKSVGKTRRLCYRMIKEGTLRYACMESDPQDPLTRPQVGYILPN